MFAQASVEFDGNLRRIYEVPPDSSFVVDGSGYRIYTPNDPQTAADILVLDLQADIWSRFSDYRAVNHWSTLALRRTGGEFEGLDQNGAEVFQSVNFYLTNTWQLVPADYPHQSQLTGNLFSDTGVFLDLARVSTPFLGLLLVKATNLITYRTTELNTDLTHVVDLLEADEERNDNTGVMTKRQRVTKTPLLVKNLTESGGVVTLDE